MWALLKRWRNRRTHKGLRAARWCGRVLFYPLFFLLLLSAILISTTPGTYLVAQVVNASVPGIKVEYESGQLNKELALNYFELDLGFLFIAIDDVKLSWNPWCSLQNKLCVKQVEAQKLTLKLTKRNSRTQPKEKDPDAPRPVMLLPFDIEVDQGFVKQGDLRIYDIQIDWQGADVAAFIGDGLVDVQRAHIEQGALHVNASKKSVSAKRAKSWGEEYWPLAQLPETYLPLRLNVPNVQAKQFDLTIGPYRTDHFNQVKVNGRWQGLDFTIHKLDFEHHNYGQLKLQGSGHLSHPYPLQLELAARPAQLPLFDGLNGSQWQILIQGDLDQLNIDAKEDGALNWVLQGYGKFSQTYLPFDLTFEGEQMIWPDLLPRPVNYQEAEGHLSGDLLAQRFSLTGQLNYHSEHYATSALVELAGRYQDQQLWLDHAKAYEMNQSGTLAGKGYLDHRDGLSWKASLDLDQLHLPNIWSDEQLIASGHLAHKGQYGGGEWQLTFNELALLGRYHDTPIELQGELSFNQKLQGEAKGLIATYGDSQLTLNGQVAQNWVVHAELQSPDVSVLHPDFTGSLNAFLDIEGAYHDPLFRFQAQSDRFSYQLFRGLDLLTIGHYRPHKEDQISLEVGVAKAKLDELELEQLQLSLQGNRSNHDFQFSSQGDILSHLSFQGAFTPSFTHWEGQLSSGQVGSHGGLWQSQPAIPIQWSLSPTELQLAAHCWSSELQSRICLEKNASLGPVSTLEASLSLSSLDVSPYLMPEEYSLTGLFEGHAKASWSKQAPLNLQANLAADKISVLYNNLVEGYIHQTALEHLQVDLDLTPTMSQIDVDVASTEQDGIWLSTQLDHLNENALSGELAINDYQLGRFTSLFPELKSMDGLLNGQLTLGGTLKSPLVQGKLGIDGGNLQLLSNPTPLDQLQLEAVFEGQKAQLNSSFQLGGGQALVQGSADWQQELTIAGSIKGKALKLLIPPQSNVRITPDLLYSYQDGQSTLTGTLFVPKADLKLNQLSGDGVAPSDDVVFVDEFEEAARRKEKQLITNVQLILGSDVEVDAFGLSGRLEGEMDLKQSGGTPLQIFGHASFHEAVFAAYGQRLSIQEKSSLHFNGAPLLASLDVKATRTIKNDDVTAGLHLTGTIEEPKIGFFSEPAMDEQEVLSYIVRGKGFGDDGLTNPQSMAATVGVTALSTLGVSKPFEELPGISSVSLDTEGEGDETQVTISGYLGERIYLKYGIGVFEPINEVTVRLYLMNQLWLESVTGIEKSLDLYYSFFIE